ncbi:MAG: chemotaxis protein CheX [Pseudomonadales bacterium]|nr:chemotaxis protein CheX [Pseudomonadales bacterium]
MKQEHIQVFIDGAVHYFKQNNASDVEVGSPYLIENDNPAAFDYTGIIGISGPKKGCVYVTAPKALLNHLLLSIGENETSEENIVDLIGEVANTVSGNARGTFGSEFMISVPVVMKGMPDSIYLPKGLRSYVIPLYWKSYSAAIVVCLQ